MASLEDVSVGGPGAARQRWGHAAGNLARLLALVLCVFTLFLVRWDAPLIVCAGLVALSLTTLYAVDRRRAGIGVWIAYVLGFVLFALLRTVTDNAGFPVRAHYAVAADEWLFGGTLPQHWLQQRLYHAGSTSVLEVACVTVIFSYYVVPHLVALGLWRRKNGEFARYALAVLIAVYTGLLVSLFLPTAPPWLASDYTSAPHITRIEAAFLNWNPESIGPGPDNGVNPVAAMPSLHLAVTSLIVVALWSRRRLRFVALAYASAMAFSLVFMGEHYVVDLIAGIATAAFAWVAASAIVRARAARREPIPATEPASAYEAARATAR